MLPPWFEGYLSLESEAARLLVYESEVVHGLLQTEDYAAEILRHPPTHHCPTRRPEPRNYAAHARSDSPGTTPCTSTW